MTPEVSVACEGYLDALVITRLLHDHGITRGPLYKVSGKHKLDAKLPNYLSAAQHSAWIVQRDLDSDAGCAPELVGRLAPKMPTGLCLIIAVRQTEAWLLAHRSAIAAHLHVAISRVPPSPESLVDAKTAIVDLARRSRRTEIRDTIVPTQGSGRRVGVGYTSHMQKFIQERWAPNEAARTSPSLAKIMQRLQWFKQTGRWPPARA
jgi:hypothetical protein